MRAFATLFSVLVLSIGVLGCQKSTTPADSQVPALGAAAEAEFNSATMWVHGMGCPQCAYNVDLQLLKVPGVERVKVDMGSGKVTATLSASNPPTREQLAEAIRQTGFTLVKIEMQ